MSAAPIQPRLIVGGIMELPSRGFTAPGGDQEHWKPTGYFWREAIETAKSREALRLIARTLVAELEDHKQAMRDKGFAPPIGNLPRNQLDALRAAGIVLEDVDNSTYLRS